MARPVRLKCPRCRGLGLLRTFLVYGNPASGHGWGQCLLCKAARPVIHTSRQEGERNIRHETVISKYPAAWEVQPTLPKPMIEPSRKAGIARYYLPS